MSIQSSLLYSIFTSYPIIFLDTFIYTHVGIIDECILEECSVALHSAVALRFEDLVTVYRVDTTASDRLPGSQVARFPGCQVPGCRVAQ